MTADIQLTEQGSYHWSVAGFSGQEAYLAYALKEAGRVGATHYRIVASPANQIPIHLLPPDKR